MSAAGQASVLVRVTQHTSWTRDCDSLGRTPGIYWELETLTKYNSPTYRHEYITTEGTLQIKPEISYSGPYSTLKTILRFFLEMILPIPTNFLNVFVL